MRIRVSLLCSCVRVGLKMLLSYMCTAVGFVLKTVNVCWGNADQKGWFIERVVASIFLCNAWRLLYAFTL